MSGRGRGRCSIGMVALVAALAIGGCGDDNGVAASGAGGDGSAASGGRNDFEGAVAVIEKARGIPTFTEPGPAFDATGASGSKVFFMANNRDNEYTRNILDATVEALKLAGVETIIGDSQANPSEAGRLIEQAINQDVDVLIVQVMNTEVISEPLKEARKAGVKIIQVNEANPQLPTPVHEEHGVVATVSYSWTGIGYLQGAAAIADAGEPMHAVAVVSSDVRISDLQAEGIRKAFEEFCPDCTLEEKDVLLSQWNERLGTVTQTAVRDPDVKYFLPLYDGMALFMLPAVHAANAQDRVKIMTTNANTGPMEALKKQDVIATEVGSHQEYTGWAIADQTLRILAGEPPVEDSHVPFRVFDSTTIDSIDISKPENEWYGDFEFKPQFMKLWGLE